MKRPALPFIAAAAALVLALAAFWLFYWRYQVSTDDAYVHGDIAPIAAQVAGAVIDVTVEDHQAVTKGQALVRIDSAEYEAKLAQAQSLRDGAKAALDQLQDQRRAAAATSAAAAADIAGVDAELRRARLDFDRVKDLRGRDNVSRQRFDLAAADLAKAEAARARAEAQANAAKSQQAVIESSAPQREAAVREAEARVALAAQDVARTRITAPANGQIGNKSVVPGQYVRPGTILLAVVSTEGLWIEANYKETQLHGIKPGQKAKISVDMLGGDGLTGTVESIAPATGALFSLLPPENATGNFTKVVQRVPVRIKVDPSPAAARLRPGLSVTVTVDTSGS